MRMQGWISDVCPGSWQGGRMHVSLTLPFPQRPCLSISSEMLQVSVLQNLIEEASGRWVKGVG